MKISQLFALFDYVTILLHQDDEIKSYSTLNWAHPVIEMKNNYFYGNCFKHGKFHLAHIWQVGQGINASGIKKWCPVSIQEFNVMIPGSVSISIHKLQIIQLKF